MPTNDRPSATLTTSQREYLRGERSFDSKRDQRTMESRIRQRIRATVDDLALLLTEGVAENRIDVQKSLDTDDIPPMWAFSGVLFAWTELEGPRATLFSDEDLDEIDSRTRLFNSQVVRGVETVFANDPPEYVVEDISNDLTIRVGPELDDLPDDVALWKLKRDTLDQLLRAGEIDTDEYGEAVKERFRRAKDGSLGTDGLRFASELVDSDE